MYPRYEQYQDSGVAWLREVPSHWEIIKNKFILDFSKGLTITKENLVDDGIPCVNYGEIHSKFGFEVIPERDDLKCVAEDYLQTTPTALLKNGDFVFADTSEDIKGSGNFTYLNSEISTLAGYHTIIARPDRQKVVPRFLAYMFDSDAHRNQVRAMVKGVKVFSVTQAFLKNTFAWLPPLPEQTAIAAFLDCKLAQIDALISKQETLLAKLAEKRTALITHAVTRGLNPAAPLKPSGVAWLGEVPEHWEVIQFKRIVESVKDGTHGTYSRVSDGYPLLSAKNVFNHGLEIGENESLITESDFQQITSNGFPRKNDLLITCVGSIGRCCVYEFDKPMAFQRSVAFLRLESKANPYFYRYFVLSSSYQKQLKANIKLSIQGGVYLNTLTSLIVYLPPLPEQTAIAHYLDTQTAQIDALSNKIRQTIARLQEYRRTLITQAVTGKIKVIGEHR